MTRVPLSVVVLLSLVTAAAAQPPATDWPQWRGANRDAVSPETVSIWPPVVLWQANVGSGVSSPIAAGGRAYAVGHRSGEDTVWCFDAESGRVLWKHSYAARSDHTSDVRLPGPRATPATDGESVYVLSLEGHLRCLDATDGTPRWVRTPGEMGVNIGQYGICNPPLLHGELLVVDLNGSCVALEKRTGRQVWRAPGGGGWNGAGPAIVRIAGKDCVIYGTGRCVDLESGRQLWSVPYGEMSVISPVVSGDLVFLAPFHGRNYGGGECVVLRAEPQRARIVWANEEVQGLCSTAVLHKGYLYAPDRDDLSIGGENGRRMNLKCIDFATGQVKWVQRPIPWPSPIVAGDKLIVQTLEGEVILADASPEGWREHGRIRAVPGLCWTMPALAEGKLYVKNIRGDLTCLRVGGTMLSGEEKRLAEVVAAEGGTATAPVVEAAADDVQRLAPPRSRWPGFRGNGRGIYGDDDAPTSWDGASGEGVLWKAPIALSGHSSPVVWGGRVFLTGANAERREVYCYSAATGELLWSRDVRVGEGAGGSAKVWDDATHAAPTPVADGQRLYALFANGDIACFSHEGQRLWAGNLGRPHNEYGHASSPVLAQDRLIIQLDQGQADQRLSRLLALDPGSGRTLWQTPRPVGAGWATPLPLEVAGRQQVVTCGNPLVISYDAASGREIWRATALEGCYYAVPAPTAAGGMVFTAAEGALLSAIRPDGSGDVSASHVAWTADEDLPTVCSPVSDGRLVFILSSSGVLSCHEARSGRRLWNHDFGDGERSFESSPSIAGRRVYFIDNQGRMYIVAAEAQFRELARNELGEKPTGATPAFADGRIYLRGQRHLYCIGREAP